MHTDCGADTNKQSRPARTNKVNMNVCISSCVFGTCKSPVTLYLRFGRTNKQRTNFRRRFLFSLRFVHGIISLYAILCLTRENTMLSSVINVLHRYNWVGISGLSCAWRLGGLDLKNIRVLGIVYTGKILSAEGHHPVLGRALMT